MEGVMRPMIGSGPISWPEGLSAGALQVKSNEGSALSGGGDSAASPVRPAYSRHRARHHRVPPYEGANRCCRARSGRAGLKPTLGQ
jgi:hypothetical protein